MKNNDEMFRSVLSRRNEYRERKKKRIRTIKRTAPVLACFFLTIVLGLGYRDSFTKLLKVPAQPNVIEEPPITVNDTTQPTDEAPESTKPPATESKSTDNSAAVSTMVIVSGTETIQTVSAQQHQSQTVATHASVSGTQVPVTTAPVADTKPITEVQTTSPVQTTVEAPKTIVNQIIPPTTTEPNNSGDGNQYAAIMLEGSIYYYTHEINIYEITNMVIDEDSILYYENVLSGNEDGIDFPMPKPGTRYFFLNEYEVAMEIDSKWVVFRKFNAAKTIPQ